MKSYIKKLNENAKLPHKAHDSDVGYDVWAIDYELTLLTKDGVWRPQVTLKTGLAIKPPEGYYWDLLPRSSVSKSLLMLANSVGIIDPGYTGELMFKFNFVGAKLTSKMEDSFGIGGFFEQVENHEYGYQNYLKEHLDLSKGKAWKIGQLVLREKLSCEMELVDELPETERGSGGFGSTGN